MLKKRYKCLLKVGLVKTTERVYNSSSSSWQLQHSNQCFQNAVDLIQYPLSASDMSKARTSQQYPSAPAHCTHHASQTIQSHAKIQQLQFKWISTTETMLTHSQTRPPAASTCNTQQPLPSTYTSLCRGSELDWRLHRESKKQDT